MNHSLSSIRWQTLCIGRRKSDGGDGMNHSLLSPLIDYFFCPSVKVWYPGVIGR